MSRLNARSVVVISAMYLGMLLLPGMRGGVHTNPRRVRPASAEHACGYYPQNWSRRA
jgi:hypothetical protein